MNISQIQQIGDLWGSEIIQSVAESFAANSSTANAGDINGNRMFYANDYMVSRALWSFRCWRFWLKRLERCNVVRDM